MLIVICKIILFIFINYVIISFLEHVIHRFLMHRRILPAYIYTIIPYFTETFEAHAVRHHRKWYKTFNSETNLIGKEENLKILLVDTVVILIGTAPIWVLLQWLSPLCGFIYPVMVFLHNRLWGLLHRQMHIPGDVFFKNWAVYRFLARYHFMHHQMTYTNFNVVFPLADLFMRRIAKPRIRDIREMLRLGLLSPRARRGRANSEKRLSLNGTPVSIRSHIIGDHTLVRTLKKNLPASF